MLRTLYSTIKLWYEELEKMQDLSLETQFWVREFLNEKIREYVYYGGKKDLSKFLKYYV